MDCFGFRGDWSGSYQFWIGICASVTKRPGLVPFWLPPSKTNTFQPGWEQVRMASSHWILNINWLSGKHEFAISLSRTLQRFCLEVLQFAFSDFVWLDNLESVDHSFEMLIAKWAHEWVRLTPFLYSGLLLWQIITERYAHLSQLRMALIVPPNTHSFVLVICVNEHNKRQYTSDEPNCNFESSWKPCLVSGVQFFEAKWCCLCSDFKCHIGLAICYQTIRTTCHR